MGFLDLFKKNADIDSGVEEFRKTDNALLIDVRTVEEYKDGHIEGSINLPLDRIFSIETVTKDKEMPLFVHCYSGSRSGQAARILKDMGYTRVTNIGGISSFSGKVVR